MGMFDTVHFPQPVTCTECGAQIADTQTKAFECMLTDYHVGDCVAHAEESRIVRARLFCDVCPPDDRQGVYLVVYRGILIDVTSDLTAAEAQLQNVSMERLVFLYHDQYAKRMNEESHRHGLARFLHDLVDWYAGDDGQVKPKQLRVRRWFNLHGFIFEQTDDPLEAVRLFRAHRKVDAEREPSETV